MKDKQFYEASIGVPSTGSGQAKTLKVQIGGLADQCSGSCLVTMGDTSVLVTAQMGNEAGGLGFFPLTCDYEERFYAAGKILGSRFVRREGRPTAEATLIARMIDRAIRPLFPAGLKREAQVIATCLSWDGNDDPATMGLIGASISLMISALPWQGPVGIVRVARINEEFVLYPSYEQREQANLDIVLAAVEQGGEILVNMIEAKAEELPEETILAAYDFAIPFLQQLIDFQKQIVVQSGVPKIELKDLALDPALALKVQEFLQGRLESALFQTDKIKLTADLEQLKIELMEMVKQEFGEEKYTDAKNVWETEQERVLDENILNKERRPDGRALDELRLLTIEAGILPRTHGTGLFTRGQTRVLSILTLGGPGDQQLLEGMDFSGKKRFMHHYNFPPYSSGEVKRLMGPGRREIGHGMLAEKALLAVIPSFDDFPYTIRIVSEVLTSNGSTSMASATAASLALMDAGVPIKRPVTGIAIGLIKRSNTDYKLLTDIQGPEDHSGDMDFKVAGSEAGVTALQMDVKTDGITRQIMAGALERGKKARLQILEQIKPVLAAPRAQLSQWAPRITILRINPEKIGAVIGTGGKVINSIIDSCNVTIDIEDDGRVFIAGLSDEMMQQAVDWIKGLTHEFEVGEILQGKVVRITDFGAFVQIAPGQDGLVHISQLANYRVNKVEDVLKMGQEIPVKVISIDESGKIALSAKDAGFAAPPPPAGGASSDRSPQERDNKPRGFFKRGRF